MTPERNGWLGLPAPACGALGAAVGESVHVVGICQGDALVSRRSGAGRRVTVDRRGRMYLPVALRNDDTALLVGAHRVNEVVVIVAVTVLERLGDVLAAGFR